MAQMPCGRLPAMDQVVCVGQAAARERTTWQPEAGSAHQLQEAEKNVLFVLQWVTISFVLS